MSREDPQFKLRMTEELRDQIAEAAKTNSRSMNAEIVARLEATFSAPTFNGDMRDAVRGALMELMSELSVFGAPVSPTQSPAAPKPKKNKER